MPPPQLPAALSVFGAPAASPELARELERLDRLVDWERRSRSPGTQGSGMRQTVEPARDLLARLGSPERGLDVVHVAGTKGKGSVSSLVHRALLAAGLPAGLYTSPHVVRVNERVVLGAEEIADGELARALGPALDAREAALAAGTAGRDASWFDVVTAAALLAFRAAGLGWAVVECGLGGRLDSTNALSGRVCVITNIDLEHTEVLGSTRAAIAREKAGILDPGTALVTGEPAGGEAGGVIDACARALGVPVLRPSGLGAGRIEEDNVALAGLVLDELGRRGATSARGGRPLGRELLDADVVRAARLPGRLDLRRVGGATVVLDGAHVPSSLRRVLDDLARAGFSAPAAACALGVGGDKDLDGLLKTLRGRVDRVVCTSVGAGPARPQGQILQAAERLGLTAETAVSPRMALSRCLDACGGQGWALVTGSLHLIGAVAPHLPGPTRC